MVLAVDEFRVSGTVAISGGGAVVPPQPAQKIEHITRLSNEPKIHVRFDRSCRRQTAEIHALASVATTVIERSMLRTITSLSELKIKVRHWRVLERMGFSCSDKMIDRSDVRKGEDILDAV